MRATGAKGWRGGRERGELTKKKRRGCRCGFSFFLVFFSQGIQSKKANQEELRSSPPRRSTMPSDNEEQAVDAKTIAELTEQVGRRKPREERGTKGFFNALAPPCNHHRLFIFSSTTMLSLSLPFATRSFRWRDGTKRAHVRHPNAVGIATRPGREPKSSLKETKLLSL